MGDLRRRAEPRHARAPRARNRVLVGGVVRGDRARFLRGLHPHWQEGWIYMYKYDKTLKIIKIIYIDI